ncbi:hypothetical protein IIA95_03990 [Patescibacteria group bacterium]|nr:hypothetical protein [Patescibacteria group bacterium]
MPERHSKPPVVLIAFFILTAGISVIFYQKISSENKRLQEELSAFMAPQVTIDNKAYDVKSGRAFRNGEPISLFKSVRVLRIARYSVLNRLDPLFALEGTDPEALERSIGYLRMSLNDFAALYESGEEEAIKESFYPLDFLERLPYLEELRQALINTPSKKIVEAYNAHLEKTMAIYLGHLYRLRKTLQAFHLIDETKEEVFNYLGGYSTFQLFVQALDALESSIIEKKTELKRRQNCFKGKTENCLSLTSRLAAMRIDAPWDDSNTKQNLLPQNIQTIKDMVLAYRRLTPKTDVSSFTIPSIALNKSACLPVKTPVYHIFWRRIDEGERAIFLEYLNNLYFLDLRPGKSYGPYTDKIKEAGLKLLYQAPVRAYMCPDSGKEISNTLKLYTIHRLLKESPLFPNDKRNLTHKKLDPLINVEKKIITGDMLYESDIEYYLSNLSALLQEYGEADLAERIGKEKVLFIETLLSIFNQGAPNFHEMILHIVETNRQAIRRITAIEGSRPPLNYLFIQRSYPMILFLGFNKSFSDTDITFLKYRPMELERLRFTTYHTDLKYIFTKQEIVDLMIQSRTIYQVIRQ